MADLIRLNNDRPGPLAERLKAFLSERVIGQERAVKDLVGAAEFFESGFRDTQTPIYIGLLAGPSGVGKTLMAEALAEFFFGDSRAFTKVDCSNVQHESDLNSLLGSPPGYVGFYDPKEDGGTPPLLDQWNIDKHDFYYRQKKGGDLSVQEKEKKILVLMRRKQSLFNILSSIMEKTAKRVADIQNQAFAMEKEIQDNRLKVKAAELADALIFLCKARSKKENKPADSVNPAEQKRLAQDILADARMRAQDLLLEHAELIEASEPVIAKIAEEFLKTDEEIQRLKQRNQMNYSPDGNYFSIVLFDEIEKAHSSLHNLLLEVADKGRLVLRNGNTTYFGNSIILMTSNAGSSVIERILVQSGIGFKSAAVKTEKSGTAPGEAIYQAVMQEIKKIFSPPFLGRLDNIIVFNPLERADYILIFDLQLQKVSASLVKEWKFAIILKINTAVREYIIDESLQNPEQGARMIKKKIRKYIMTPLVQMKNNKEVVEGDMISVELEKAGDEQRVILRRLPRRGEEGFDQNQLAS